MSAANFINVLESFFLPPGIFVSLFIFSLFLLPRFYRLAVTLMIVNCFGLYLFTTPFFSYRLIDKLENQHREISSEQLKDTTAQAIVVLGGGRLRRAYEYGGDTVNNFSLDRVRYAAYLRKSSKLPLYVTGGKSDPQDIPEAELMKQVLEDEYKVPVAGMEIRSQSTWENAFFMKKLLQEKGIKKIILVTHAAHMPRSVFAFNAAGLEVVPAPTVFFNRGYKGSGIGALAPDPRALWVTSIASHEFVGKWWYQVRKPTVKDPIVTEENSPKTSPEKERPFTSMLEEGKTSAKIPR